jgi:hypothetical protein
MTIQERCIVMQGHERARDEARAGEANDEANDEANVSLRHTFPTDERGQAPNGRGIVAWSRAIPCDRDVPVSGS